MFPSEKRHWLRIYLLRTQNVIFVCVRRNLAFRATEAEDTHLTPVGIQFKAGVGNSFFCYKHARKKLQSFRSCRIFNSLVYTRLMMYRNV